MTPSVGVVPTISFTIALPDRPRSPVLFTVNCFSIWRTTGSTTFHPCEVLVNAAALWRMKAIILVVRAKKQVCNMWL
jgi:hypothetical protein